MFTRMVLVCVGLMSIPDIAAAEEAAAGPAASATAPTAAKEPSPPATRADLEAFAARLEAKMDEKLDARMTRTAEWQREAQSKIISLEEKVRALSDFRDGDRQALEQIAKKDNDGKSYLRIDASHEPTRLELRRAIEASTPKTGIVTIRNKMDYDQWVGINSKMYQVMAKHELDVSVDYGEFRVKLKGSPEYTRQFAYPSSKTDLNIVAAASWQWVEIWPGYWGWAWR